MGQPGRRVEPLPLLRRAIGDRLLSSVRATAQVTITFEVDLTDLDGALETATAATGKLHGILGATIRAAAVALRDHPALTAAWVADGLAFPGRINPPQSAILGLGRARLRAAVVGGAIVPRRLAVLSLTFDHRVVDGKPAAAFLDALLGLLEAPDRLLREGA